MGKIKKINICAIIIALFLALSGGILLSHSNNSEIVETTINVVQQQDSGLSNNSIFVEPEIPVSENGLGIQATNGNGDTYWIRAYVQIGSSSVESDIGGWVATGDNTSWGVNSSTKNSTWGYAYHAKTGFKFLGIYYGPTTSYNKLSSSFYEDTGSYYRFDFTNIFAPSIYGGAVNTIYAIYQPTTVTVSFQASPSSYGSVDTSSVTAYYGSTFYVVGAQAMIWYPGLTNLVNTRYINASPNSNTAQYSYSFDCWTYSGATFVNYEDWHITSSCTIYANFDRDTREYTISASVNNSSYGSVSGGGTYEYGATCTLTASHKSGYKFSSWSNGSTSNPLTFTVTGSASYTANFVEDKYTVSFKVNDSNLGKVDKSSITNVSYGTTVTTSNDTITIGSTKVTATKIDKDGYTTTFSSWSNAPASITGAVTITATFTRTANTYYVAYDANDGIGKMDPSEHTYGTVSNLTANAFTRTGYTFTGWKNATGTSYSDKAAISNLTSSPNATITLYAQWEPNTVNYNVKHFVMDTSGKYPTSATKTQTLSGKVDTSLTLANLKDTSLTSTGITYSYGQAYGTTVTTATIPTSGTLEISLYYARGLYNVLLTTGVGIQSVSGAGKYYYGTTVTINATVKTGCTWANWTNTQGVEVTKTQQYTFTMQAGDITYRANATDKIYPTVNITKLNHKTFTWQASDNDGIAGYEITTNSNTPTSWKPAATSGSFEVTSAATYFVHVKDDSGNASSASIAAFALTITEAKGTTLAVSASGTALSNGAVVLNGTEIYAEASMLAGYANVTLKDGADEVDNPYTTTVSQNKTISTTVEKIPYTITYTLNGGDVAEGNPETYTIEDTFTLNNPTKDGYTFLGWTGSNLTAPALEVTIASGTTGDKEFAANWEVNTYSVAYDNNGGKGEMPNTAHTYDEEQTLPQNAFTKAGYSFVGWNRQSDGLGAFFNDQETVLNLTATAGEIVTLYAIWQPNIMPYTISHFVMDTNGKYPTTATKTETREDAVDTTLTLADLQDASLVSDGIAYSHGTAYGVEYFEVTIPPEGELAISLFYERSAYEVELTAGAGIVSVSGAKTYFFGASVTINAVVEIGYAWIEWTGTETIAAQEYTFEMPAHSLALKATARDTTIPEVAISATSFNTFTWTATDEIGVIAGWAITTSASTPSQWNAGETSGSFEVTSAATYFVHVKDDSGNASSASIEAFALTITEAKGTTLAVSASGAALSNGAVVLNGTEIYAEASMLAGYANVTLKDGDAGVTNPYTITVSQNKTISTTVEKIPYTITYTLNGGDVAEGNPETYTIEDTFPLNNPTKDGYTFLGWTGSNGEAPALEVTIALGTTGNKEFAANWQVNTYAVAYDNNGGKGTMPNTAHTYDEEQTLPQNAFTKAGYSFVGWNRQSDGLGAFFNDQETVLNLTATAGEIVTLYAIWQPNIMPYTISHFVMDTSGHYADLPTKTETREDAVDTTLTLADLQDTSLVSDGIAYNHGTAYGVEYFEVTIPPEGELAISLFYERSAYEVELTAGAGIASVSGAGKYYFGASVTINAVFETGYAWIEWTGTETIAAQEYTFEMPAHSVALKATARDTTIPEVAISATSFNTFTWSATDEIGVIAGWAITTSASTPSQWNAGETSGSFEVTSAATYFVHVKDDSGNASSASIEAFALTITEAKGTTLAVSANGAALSNGAVVLAGTEINAEASALAGYQSIKLKDGNVEVDNPYTTTVSQNKTISTTVEKISYKITYTLNGGVVDKDNPENYTIEDTFTLNNPTKDGYTFLGWTGSNLAAPALEVTIASGTTGDKEFAANWEVIPAAQPVITSQPVGGKTPYGEAMTLAVIAEILDGYVLTYQWFKNGEPIESATDRLFTTDETILAGDVSEYCVKITATRNDNGQSSFVMSDIAIVEVEFLNFENVEVQGSYIGEFTGETRQIVASTTTPYALIEYSIDNATWQTEAFEFVDVTDGAQTIYWQITKANYNTQTGSEIIDITKAQNNWKVQPNILGWIYGENKNSPVGEATFGEVKFDYALQGTSDFSNNVPTDAGEYVLRATVEDNLNFEGLALEVEFAIHQREVVISWGQTNFFFDNTPKLPTAGVGNVIAGDTCEAIVEGAQTEASETPYLATVVGLSNANYKLPAMGIAVEFYITYQQIAGVVVEGFAGVYDNAPHGVSVSGFEAGDVISYSLDESVWQALPITRTDAGTTSVFVKVEREFFAPFVAYAEISISQVVLEKPSADASVYIFNGQVQTYQPLGFDEQTMTIANNQHTLANENGYVVVVEIADKTNFVWADDTQENLEFLFVIEKMMPSVITMPTFSSVFTGQTLADVQIIGGEMNVLGAFSWETPDQKIQNGQNTATLVFTPNDEDNYKIFSQSVNVLAEQITITFEVSNPELGDVSTRQILCDYGTQISVFENQIVVGDATIIANVKTIEGALVEFVSWTNATDGVVTEPIDIIANFEITTIFVSVSERNYFMENTNEVLGGSASLENQNEKVVQYSVGDQIIAKAAPINGYELYAWVVNGQQQVSTAPNMLEITAGTQPLTIVAVFIGQKVEVVLEGNNACPNDILGGNKNGKYYHTGDVIEIDATANAGYVFDGTWLHPVAGEIQGPTYTITAQDAQSGKVTLTAQTFNELISVNFVISGGGSATLQNYESNVNTNAYKIHYAADIVAAFSASTRYVFAGGTFVVDQAAAKSLESYIQNDLIEIPSQEFAKAIQITITLIFEEVLWQDYVFDNMIQSNGATQEVLYGFDFPGLGTKDAPYQINTPEQFALLSFIVNNNIAQTNQNKQPYNAADTNYVVNGQLDLQNRFWTPIGTVDNPFNATIKFEKPTGIYLSSATNAQIGTLYDEKVMDRHEGLFGYLGSHAKINPNPLMSKVLPIGLGVILGIIALWVIIALIRRKNRSKSLGEAHTITPVALEETAGAPKQGVRSERPQRQAEKPAEAENVTAEPQTAVPPRPQRSSGAMQTENLTPEREGKTNVPPRPQRNSAPSQTQTKVPPRPTRK